jgi:hypothetical protein
MRCHQTFLILKVGHSTKRNWEKYPIELPFFRNGVGLLQDRIVRGFLHFDLLQTQSESDFRKNVP